MINNETTYDYISRLIQDKYNTKFALIDDSHKHKGHSGYSDAGSHFTLMFDKSDFIGISRVNLHREILSIFKEDIPDRIHALSIKLK